MRISQSLSNLDRQNLPMQIQTTQDKIENFLAKKFRLSRSFATRKSYETGLNKFIEFVGSKYGLNLDSLVIQTKETHQIDPIQVLDDYSIMIAHLPKRYRDKIEFILGLQNIEKSLSKVGDREQIPYRIIEATLTNLDNCLEIVRKQYDQRLEKIAKVDFDKVKDWLTMVQKYPKAKGAGL